MLSIHRCFVPHWPINARVQNLPASVSYHPQNLGTLLGYWIHGIRCSVNLVKPFHLIILYPMLMCITFPLQSWRTLNLSPSHRAIKFVSIAVRVTLKEMKMRMTMIKTGWKKDEDTGKTRSQARSRYLWLRSQCQALWWPDRDMSSSLCSLHLWPLCELV